MMNKSKVMQKASSIDSKRVNTKNGRKKNTMAHHKTKKLEREMVGGEPYEYYRLGRYIVSAPGICGGRPTFKYTRIDVRHALRLISEGYTVERVANAWQLPVEAVQEALELASKVLFERPLKEIPKAA
jgi:uncharacterized protein (DUF433 family)